MKIQHILAALFAMLIWGFNFVVIRLGVGDVPPLLLLVMRFVVTSLFIVVIKPPKLAWGKVAILSLFMYLGQYAFLFLSIKWGMPPGLVSVLYQSQIVLIIILSAVFLKERPTRQQIIGDVVCVVGFFIIATTLRHTEGVSVKGFAALLVSIVCMSVATILLRQFCIQRKGEVNMLSLVVWMSLFPPVPALGLAYVTSGPTVILNALSSIGWVGVGAIVYISVFSTIVTYGILGRLLKIYPATQVAQFYLLIPIFGMLTSYFVLGEVFTVVQGIGIVFVLSGVAVCCVDFRKIGFGRKCAVEQA